MECGEAFGLPVAHILGGYKSEHFKRNLLVMSVTCRVSIAWNVQWYWLSYPAIRIFIHVPSATLSFTVFTLTHSHTHTLTHTATDDFIDIPEVYGCRVITVTAVMYPGEDKDPLQLLMDNEGMQGECPLDIKIDLMVSN